MDISVIIPSLNGFNFLSKYLSSVIKACASSKYETEIIVVDDKSDDGTLEKFNVMFGKEKSVRLLVNPKKGACSARNYGVSKANGKYLLFIDNDVILEEDFFSKVIHLLDNPEIGAVTCAGYLMSNEKQLDGIKIPEWKRGFMRFTKNIYNDKIKSLDIYIYIYRMDCRVHTFYVQKNYI